MEKYLLTGDTSVKLAENDGCSVYQLRNEAGEGTITIYEVFPGVSLSYNEFHIRHYGSEFKPDRNLFCIDHCREGRLVKDFPVNLRSLQEKFCSGIPQENGNGTDGLPEPDTAVGMGHFPHGKSICLIGAKWAGRSGKQNLAVL